MHSVSPIIDQYLFRKWLAFNHLTVQGNEIEVAHIVIGLAILLFKPSLPYHLRKQEGPGTMPALQYYPHLILSKGAVFVTVTMET